MPAPAKAAFEARRGEALPGSPAVVRALQPSRTLFGSPEKRPDILPNIVLDGRAGMAEAIVGRR
jgi:hypothetical protein